MKINSIALTKQNITFAGKSPNDSTYWLLKNPETASDAMERGFAESFIRMNPNWEQDEALVHRLKQDTIAARAMGKIHSQWHEFDTYPGISFLFSIVTAALCAHQLLKSKNNISSLSKYEKILFPSGIVLCTVSACNNLKYILTGRKLFEKKKEEKQAVN